jgi:phenylacetyl-CoA:acceptor oxidoreductase 27-kDa subunit
MKDGNYRWGMLIDLNKCIGCDSCAIVCREMNKVSPTSNKRILHLGFDPRTNYHRIHLPLNCMQCENPPCVSVCPTTATFQRQDGIVDINHELCIGCSSCVFACPYGSRHISTGYPDEGNDGFDAFIGTCIKCDFCLLKIEYGLNNGAFPGTTRATTPECVLTCSAKAVVFGDLNDPESEISVKKKKLNARPLREELGTNPSTFYVFPDGYDEESSVT